MDVELSIDDRVWKERMRKLEALTGADPSSRQHDLAQLDKIMDPHLFSVAKKGDVDEFIKALEDHCAKERVSLPVLLERRSPSKNTLLHAAAESDDNVRAVIHFFPEHLIYCENSKGESPLHIAAREGKAVAVELLLRQGVLIDPDRRGNSALHEAVRNHHLKVIDQLVSKDPSLLYCHNNESKSPLCVAVETGKLEVLEHLLEVPNNDEDWRRSESEGVFHMSPVHVAIIRKEKDMLSKMWEKKPWLFQLRDAGNGTPLHLAAYTNYLDGVMFLIEKCPASALEQDSTDGYLPIHIASMMDHIKIVKELLRQWPDPAEFLTRLGQNILHVSASYGNFATVKYILKSPKFSHLINARDFDGNTPFHLATLHCQPTVLLLARDGRVNPNLVNRNNMTALDVAQQDIKVKMVPPLRKRLTERIVASVEIPRSELVICKPTGRRPPIRREPPEPNEMKDRVNTRMVVAGLIASVTFTSGFSIPGGYNSSDPDAGIPILLHKAVYNVFVISNSIAMYSSIMVLVTLLWTHVNDPDMMLRAYSLSNFALFVTLAAMPLAFIAGVYVTVTELSGLSIFVLVFGSFALLIILSIFISLYIPFVRRYPLNCGLTNLLISLCLVRARRETARGETAGSAATSVRGTRDDDVRPPT